MGLIKKNIKEEASNTKICYEDLARQESEKAIDKIRKEAQELEAAYNQARKIYFENPCDETNEFLKSVSEKWKNKQKELSEAHYKNKADFNLLSLAERLDLIDCNEKAKKIHNEMLLKAKELIKLRAAMNRVYGKQMRSTNGYQIDYAIDNLVTSLNQFRISSYDKNELEKQFNERMEYLKKEQKKKEDRIKILSDLSNR